MRTRTEDSARADLSVLGRQVSEPRTGLDTTIYPEIADREELLAMSAAVQLIAGPARCGKTQLMFSEYRQALGSSTERPASPIGRCCWLAPNQVATSQLQDSLMSRTGDGIFEPNLYTFAGFAESLIAGSKRRVRPITAAQKRRLLQHAISKAIEGRKIGHFAQVASTTGFVSQVDLFVADLKRADIWPEDFQQWCQTQPRADRRSRELAAIYDNYQQLLHRSELYDAEGRFWAAREILAESIASDRRNYDLVVVNGFNDFTTAQYDILQLLGECSGRMLLSLTVDQRPAETGNSEPLLFAKTRHTLDRLLQTFPNLNVEYLTPPQPTASSLQQLQQHAFRKAADEERQVEGLTTEEFRGVEILAANSELEEIEAIAQRIKSLLQQQQANPQDILIVGRSGEGMATLISAVFPEFGIPFAMELRPRLEAEPLVRALQTLLRVHQEDWPFQPLLEVVGNRLFSKFSAEEDSAGSYALLPRIALEHCVRSAQLPDGRKALLEQLEYRQNLAAQDADGEADRRSAQVSLALHELRQLDELLSALPAEATIDQWSATIETLLSRLDALSSATSHSTRASHGWNLLRRELRGIALVDDWSQTEPQVLKLSDLQQLIVTITREQRLPAPHDAIGRVRILSAESARKLSTKHLFLVGLGEQAFSSGTFVDQPSSTTESQTLSTNVPESLADPDDASLSHSEPLLLFYELVTRASESLTLSYPALDAKGQPLSPSPLLIDLQRSVGLGRIVHTTMTMAQEPVLGRGAHSLSGFRRQAVQQALASKPQWLAGMISSPQHVRTGSAILSGVDAVAQRSTRDTFGAYEGLLLSDAAATALARQFDGEHLWSPSQLESYAACPFRFFAEQLLGLEPLSELILSNDARRRGSLLHQVLAEIHLQLSREKLGETTSDQTSHELVRRFLAALDAAVKASPLRGIEHSLREIERREIEAWADDYATQEQNYRSQWKHLDEPPSPTYFEVRFGPETRGGADTSDRASTPLPFELDLGAERIRLTGQIDRVDVGRVGEVTVFNIIDYKSGQEVKLKLDKVRSGRQLQLPLYALAAEQLLLAEQGAVALATGYWNIRGKGFETRPGASLQLHELADQTLRTSADWQQLQPEIFNRVQQLIRGIRKGEFPVYNEDEHCTRSCALSTICRIGQIRNMEKIWPLEVENAGGANGE